MRKLFSVLLVVLGAFGVFSCGKSPNSTDTLHDYELMYERVLPTINPDRGDMTKEMAQLVNWRGAGQSSSRFTQVEESKWVARFSKIPDEVNAYHVFLSDEKVVKLVLGEVIPSVAVKVYMRGYGETEWVLLTSIEPNGLQVGECAEVILRGGTVRNP